MATRVGRKSVWMTPWNWLTSKTPSLVQDSGTCNLYGSSYSQCCVQIPIFAITATVIHLRQVVMTPLNLQTTKTLLWYQNLGIISYAALSEKSPKWDFLITLISPISFRGHATKFRGCVFYCRRTYEPTSGKVSKKLDVKYNGRLLLHRGRP